jgi:hypothetical protein
MALNPYPHLIVFQNVTKNVSLKTKNFLEAIKYLRHLKTLKSLKNYQHNVKKIF